MKPKLSGIIHQALSNLRLSPIPVSTSRQAGNILTSPLTPNPCNSTHDNSGVFSEPQTTCPQEGNQDRLRTDLHLNPFLNPQSMTGHQLPLLEA